MRFAIIGGTGFYEASEKEPESRSIATDYGEVTVDLIKVGEETAVFLPRHGREHSIAPHRINYRANMAALRELGVENVLASAAVGSLNKTMAPGELALPTQFIDFTHGREGTFFDGEEVRHQDMTEPYCPSLREALVNCALAKGLVVHPEAVYVCTQGPRFETPAEIEMFRRAGGDLVGMTGVPEVVLARELGLCYASLALIANWAAGIGEGPVSHAEVSSLVRERISVIRDLFFTVISAYDKASPGDDETRQQAS